MHDLTGIAVISLEQTVTARYASAKLAQAAAHVIKSGGRAAVLPPQRSGEGRNIAVSPFQATEPAHSNNSKQA